MSDLITSQMLSDWRANYGLDKRTPIKAMHWWQDNMDGMAPAGVVAALGLCINEIERLTAERDALLEALQHMQHCASCAEDYWQNCEGGRAALAAIDAAKGRA